MIPPTTPAHGPHCQPGPAAEPRAEDHHPLEADVDDAGALGVQAAERREADRHRGRRAAPNVPLDVRSLAPVTARTNAEHREAHAEHERAIVPVHDSCGR